MTDDYGRIRQMLLNDKYYEIVARGGTEVIPALIDALNDGDEIVQGRAAHVLGKIGDASAIPPLTAVLKSGDERMRASAARALGYITEDHPEYDRSEAGPALIEALKDSNNIVRLEAIHALKRISLADLQAVMTYSPCDEKLSLKFMPPENQQRQTNRKNAILGLIAALSDENTEVVQADIAKAVSEIAEKREIRLEDVRKALGDYVDSVRKRGNPAETTSAEREAAGHYIQISKAVAKFRAGLHSGMEGVMLEGTVRPPSKGKMYRAAREARAVV